MAVPHRPRQRGLRFAGHPGSPREARPPGRVQNPSLEVQVLPDTARGQAATAEGANVEHAYAVSPTGTALAPSKVASRNGIPRSWCIPW